MSVSRRGDKLRVALDARPLSHPQAGGFRSYVRQLIHGFAERGVDDLELLLYIDRPLDPAAEAALPKGAIVRVLSPSRLKTDFALFARQVRADSPDLVHGTMNYLPINLPAPTALTIHDAFGIRRYFWEAGIRRDSRQWAINRYWAAMTRASAKRARRIVTDSHGAASELAEALRRPVSDFHVVYLGLSLPPPCPGVVRDPRAALMIAGPDARKNVETIYAAFANHGSAFGADGPPRLDVVCTSAKTAARAQDDLARHNLTHFRLLSGLDDAALTDAMARSAVFLWPSRREGFGLPPLEAMQAGCAVASSNALPMPEILGDLPRYFDPESPEALARAVAELLADPHDARARGEAGRARAATFTCRRLADEMVTQWKEAAAR